MKRFIRYWLARLGFFKWMNYIPAEVLEHVAIAHAKDTAQLRLEVYLLDLRWKNACRFANAELNSKPSKYTSGP